MSVLSRGQQLGAYVLGAILGRGGMADVYSASHKELGRPAAVKVLDTALQTDPTFPVRFQREARTVARLVHPNIVGVFDYGAQGQFAYLAMELASGGTLREKASQYRTLQQGVEGLAPVFEALDFAHRQGVVHRDVKPINVLFDSAGRALLADFGVARVAEESLDLTESGVSVGSPYYMAPQQAMGEDVDHRADIYALGIMAYEMVTGMVPYLGATPYAVMQQHVSAPPPSVRNVIPNAPVSLDEAIKKACAKRPKDRFSSAAEFLSALRRAAAEAPNLPIGGGRAPLTSFEEATRLNRTVVMEKPWVPGAGPPPLPQAEPLAAAGKGRRPTSLNIFHRIGLGVLSTFISYLFVLGAWRVLPLWESTRTDFGAPAAVFLYRNLGSIRIAFMALALVFAIGAILTMGSAIVVDFHFPRRWYQRLRQNHRFIGYTALFLAIAGQGLGYVGMIGAGRATPLGLLQIVLGLALITLVISKVLIVRFIPAARLYLPWIGLSAVMLFAMVLITGVFPAW